MIYHEIDIGKTVSTLKMELYDVKLKVNTVTDADFELTIKCSGSVFKLLIEHEDLDKENLERFIDKARNGEVMRLALEDKSLEIHTSDNRIFFSFEESESVASITYSVSCPVVLPCFEKMLEYF